MTKIKKDFLGYYVSAGGYISRPLISDNINESSIVKAKHIGSTTIAILKDDSGKEFKWKTTGISSLDYQNCKNHLNNDDFEKVVMIKAADYLLGQPLYPQFFEFLGNEYVDYRDPKVLANLDWAKLKIEESRTEKFNDVNKKSINVVKF